MPRKEAFPYSHSVGKTWKDHICHGCGEVIPKGSRASYKNLFTGRRGYIHEPRSICSKNIERKRQARKARLDALEE